MSTVTLRVGCPVGCQCTSSPEPVCVEMSGVTSITYAAKRVAEAIGQDPDFPWRLRSHGAALIPEGDLAMDYDGSLVNLVQIEP